MNTQALGLVVSKRPSYETAAFLCVPMATHNGWLGTGITATVSDAEGASPG